MKIFLRALFLISILLFFSADFVLAGDNESILNGVAKGTEITAGIITSGFGMWQFFVPELYGWEEYFADDPPELRKAVEATNFFFSSSLILMESLRSYYQQYFLKQMM